MQTFVFSFVIVKKNGHVSENVLFHFLFGEKEIEDVFAQVKAGLLTVSFFTLGELVALAKEGRTKERAEREAKGLRSLL